MATNCWLARAPCSVAWAGTTRKDMSFGAGHADARQQQECARKSHGLGSTIIGNVLVKRTSPSFPFTSGRATRRTFCGSVETGAVGVGGQGQHQSLGSRRVAFAFADGGRRIFIRLIIRAGHCRNSGRKRLGGYDHGAAIILFAVERHGNRLRLSLRQIQSIDVDPHLADVRNLRPHLHAILEIVAGEVGCGVADLQGIVARVAQRQDGFGLHRFGQGAACMRPCRRKCCWRLPRPLR